MKEPQCLVPPHNVPLSFVSGSSYILDFLTGLSTNFLSSIPFSNPNYKHTVAGRLKPCTILNRYSKHSFYTLYQHSKMCQRQRVIWQCGCQETTVKSCYPYKCPGVTQVLVRREANCLRHQVGTLTWTKANKGNAKGR